MDRSHRLGDLQHDIMRVLWEEGEATVARVHERLAGERERALTTIATMLSKMEKKGVVLHRVDGRQYVYRARVTEAEVTRGVVSELCERFFAGDVTALVGHLLREQDVDPDELERLRALIERHEEDGGAR